MTSPTAPSSPRTVALLLAGGAGTRFWPASRSLRPKQLLPLAGDEPLLASTARRILPLLGGWRDVLVATGAHLVDATHAVLPEIDAQQMLVEPVPRNTAPAIAWAAARVARQDPDAVLRVLPSDHHIADEEEFRRTLRAAVASAASGVVTTVGIRPTRAETGYGYIELAEGAAMTPGTAVRARGFVEKPDLARAQQFLAGGRHLWNAGMFFFRARDLLAAVRAHLPAVAEALLRFDAAAAAGDEPRVVSALFPGMPAVSIDHGVMEHIAELAVVPGDFGWSDVGGWQSAWELAAHDTDGNSAPPGTVLIDARDNHVVDLREGSTARVVALCGVDGLVVVQTEDALLVTTRARAQEVRDVVDRLKNGGRSGLT
ncbi:MAG: sugar phosphate nucleotidyltransferase [Polyangiaceae bacterium]